ncbi:MAG: hypothetical protein KKH99_05200, partial [Proteobacteria bacterium]|nr:hypothetical protein [Pseudomonadota bacterium]
MKNKLIMQSLPLVAAVLGNKYGVKVNIGGSEAFTDGSTINLPGLPMESDETLISLARGYIDHESAHIRETDFDAVENAKLTPLEMCIWNCIEDWRVEEKLSSIFSGCKINFHWLIRHIFYDATIDNQRSAAQMIPNWILLMVRSWQVPDLSDARDQVEAIVENRYPGLSRKIKSALQEVQSKCVTTDDSIFYAKKIVSFIENEATGKTASHPPSNKEQKPSEKSENDNAVQIPSVDKNQHGDSKQQLNKFLHSGADELPKGLGEILQENLAKKASSDFEDKVSVAVVGKRLFTSMDSTKFHDLTKSTTALKTRLQSMLQSILLKRSRLSRQGKLDTRRLYKIAVSDPRMFIKSEEKQGFNTAVHILIDCSGSMDMRMELTTHACYSLAKALDSIKGINIGVTAFPADPPLLAGSQNNETTAV